MAMAFAGSRVRLGRRLILAAPFALAAGGAFAQNNGDIQFQRSSLLIETGGRQLKFDVELALNDSERARGLMFREKLGPYDGMLFDFFQEAPVSFWMKNTVIPLDMIFIRGDGTIARIASDTIPYSLEPVDSGEPVAAVLELAGGKAAALGIAEDDVVTWEDK